MCASLVKWKELTNILVNYVIIVNESELIIVLRMWNFTSHSVSTTIPIILHVWCIFLFYYCSLESLSLSLSLLVYRDLTWLYAIHTSNSTSTIAVNYDFTSFWESEHFTRYKIAMVYRNVFPRFWRLRHFATNAAGFFYFAFYFTNVMHQRGKATAAFRTVPSTSSGKAPRKNILFSFRELRY